jgi:hypothetical protein
MILQVLPFGLTVSSLLQIIVSLLIAGLYYLTWRVQRRQANIQETQNQIMEWQTRLMAAEYEPDIVVEDFSADGNTAEITLSNVGRGRATDLKMQCLLYHKEDDGYLTAFSNKVLGFVVTPKDLRLSRLGEKETFIGGESVVNTNTENDSLKNSIGVQEQNIVFHTDVELEIKSIRPVMDVNFTRAVEQIMEKWDVETIGFDFYLTYTDAVDQEFPVRIKSIKDVEVIEGLDLSDALESGEEMDAAVSTPVPDAAKPDDIQIMEQMT